MSMLTHGIYLYVKAAVNKIDSAKMLFSAARLIEILSISDFRN